MSSIDEQFVEFIIKSLVGNPDAVDIKRTIDEKGVLLELTVDPEDLGRVIGKRGATAQSVRTLLRALGTKNDARYNLKIIDNGVPRPERQSRDHDKDNDTSTDNASKDDNKSESASEESTDSKPSNESEPEPEKTTEESLAEKTRKELSDLDDLDI